MLVSFINLYNIPITTQELIAKYNGKYCSILTSTSRQCFDVAVAYTDGLGVPHYPGNPSPFPYMNAYQIYTDFSAWQAQYFDRIANSPTGVPQAGDIIIWSNSYGSAGHVAVATGVGDTNTFQAFSQNDPFDSVCVLKTYNYNSVLGWLRYNKSVSQPVDDCPAKLIQITAERDRLNGVITGKDETITHLGDTITQKNNEIVQLQATVASQKDTLLIKEQQLATAQEQAVKVPELTKQLADSESSLILYKQQVSALQTQLGTIKSKLVPKKYLSIKLYNLIMALE